MIEYADVENGIDFDARIDEKGGIHPDQATVVRVRLSKLKGRRVSIRISKYVKGKTNPQLGYYYGVVLPAWCEFAGYSENEMHVELKVAYFPKRHGLSKLSGEEYDNYIPSLKDASSEEMSTFLERVVREGRMQGIPIPSSDDDLGGAL